MAKRQKTLTSKEFAKNCIALCDDDILQYGARIVPASVGIATLNKKFGLDLARNFLLNRCIYGKLTPMGKYRGRYYFYRADIDMIRPFPQAHRRPPVAATDRREEVPAADRRELVVA